MWLRVNAGLTGRNRAGLRTASGIRTSVGMASAIAFTLLINEPRIGLAAAFGVFVVGMGDMGGQFRPRVVDLLAGAGLAAVSATAAAALGNSIIAGAAGMFIIAFLTTLSQTAGGRAFGILFGAEILYLMSVASPKGPLESLEFGGAVFVGGLWALLLLLISASFDRIGPAQRQLAVSIRAVSDLILDSARDMDAFSAARARAGIALTDAGNLIASMPSSRRSRSQANDLAVLLGSARRIWVDVSLVRAALRDSDDSGRDALMAELEPRADRLRKAANSLAVSKDRPGPSASRDPQLSPRDPIDPGNPSNPRLTDTAAAALRVIDSDLRDIEFEDPTKDQINRQDMPAHVRAVGQPLPGASQLHLRAELRQMRNNLTPSSTTFRHAIRMAVVTGLTIPLYRLLDLDHGYWLTLTVVIVLQQDFGATITKGIQRVFGTLIGGVIGWQIAAHLENPWGIALATSILAGLAVALLKYNYFIYTWALTPFVILMASSNSGSALDTGELRLALTASGGVIALLAAYYLWPGWRLVHPRTQLAQALDRIGEYTGLVLDSMTDPQSDLATTQAARSADIELSGASSEIQRYAALPERKRGDPAGVQSILNHSRLLLGAAQSLARLNSYPVPVGLDLSAYSQAITGELAAAAGCLRSPATTSSIDPAKLPVPGYLATATADFKNMSRASATLLTVIDTQSARLAYEACNQD